jgi:hypothetical protein
MGKRFFQDEAIAASSYHYDTSRIDPRFDTCIGLGTFEGDWSAELDEIIATATPRTFSSRGAGPEVVYKGPQPKDNNMSQNDHEQEEKEFFEKVKYDYYNYQIINKANPEKYPVLQKMIDAFAFAEPSQATIHVQTTGQVFPWHLDIFQNRELYDNSDRSKVMRLQVMLNDWQPGQWFGYGNYTFTHWKAGDIHTFDVNNTPHYTANASYTPRANLMITGIITKETEEFLLRARNNKTIKV